MDTIHFDASITSNPGGAIRAAWVIVRNGCEKTTGTREWESNARNTVNVAEYLAARAGLNAYVKSGGSGPVELIGDSQLVIRQLSGEYGVGAPDLVRLHAQVEELVARVPGGVMFRWVPRVLNSEADAIASPHVRFVSRGREVAKGIWKNTLSAEMRAFLPPLHHADTLPEDGTYCKKCRHASWARPDVLRDLGIVVCARCHPPKKWERLAARSQPNADMPMPERKERAA